MEAQPTERRRPWYQGTRLRRDVFDIYFNFPQFPLLEEATVKNTKERNSTTRSLCQLGLGKQKKNKKK
jgi:hypothetical protein